MNTSEKHNFRQKNSHDLLISATNSWGSEPTIVALVGDGFTPRDGVESPVFKASQLSKPCCLATISCASPSLKLEARISASGTFRKRGIRPRICAATG